MAALLKVAGVIYEEMKLQVKCRGVSILCSSAEWLMTTDNEPVYKTNLEGYILVF